jgi:hypothetical protein
MAQRLAFALSIALAGQACSTLTPTVAPGECVQEQGGLLRTLVVHNRGSGKAIFLGTIAERMPQVEELSVVGKPLPVRELNGLSGLKNLRHLNLSLVEGVVGNESREFRLPASLESLSLQAFPLDRLPELVEALNRAPAVTKLGLYGIGLEQTHATALSGLVWIEELGLEDNLGLSDEVLDSLAKIETMTSLGLNGTSIHAPWPQIFERLPQLQSLYAWGVPRYRGDLDGKGE